MPRYPSEHKLQTRRRILEAAGRRMKSDGIDGSGVAVLMSDAGLTNGAFYSHFDTKSDLVAAVVAQQMDTYVAMVESLPPGPAGLDAYIGAYLSPEHRDDLAGGCPSAALLDEIGRCDDGVREAYDDGLQRFLATVAARLSGDLGLEPDLARTRAVGLYTVLVATLQLARAVADPAQSQQILEAGAANARALIGPGTGGGRS
ncbi:DNA-binding transcriptional regulator, AcrR family [Nocardioides exalbidus]|uniref:DNA-binding transcriptional regulator, AcrR family n=1 Tax=Nocardioides exalbidus TaxID=402596 RepID=A0A1H4NC59_9ACTN|nr:TetR/AcrR family transcriptional regulator [Nocardioides exalbidus]SEB92843.1 DNA-binding transcriptional regulator, AcrR family [Nocardioides exalbidus]